MGAPLPIATGFYEDFSRPIAAQECTNWIPQIPLTNAQSQAQLIGTPGIEERSQAGTKAARGIHVMNGVPYTVNGNNLYRENNDGTTTDLGAIPGTGRVSMADNGTQLCIVVPAQDGYIFTNSPDTLTQITDADFTTTFGYSEQVVYKDGFFVHYSNNATVGTGVITFVSALNDGLTYGALDFSSAEEDPDKITGIHVNSNILRINGEKTTEAQQNVGTLNYPFAKIQGATIPKGAAAKFSLVEFDNAYAMVGRGENEQPAVYIVRGGQPQKISTAAIERLLDDLTESELENVFCTTYAKNGGYFLNVHLPSRCFTYDSFASQVGQKPFWHERKSKDEFGRPTTWRVNGIVDVYGKTVVTDNQSGRIGNLENDVYTEYGTTINRVVSTQPFTNQGRSVNVSQMELFCESGVGNITGDGSDPVIRRSFSDDGGRTFKYETSRKLGKQGEYNARQIWRREGQFRNSRVYKFEHSEPVKAVIIKLEADFL